MIEGLKTEGSWGDDHGHSWKLRRQESSRLVVDG